MSRGAERIDPFQYPPRGMCREEAARYVGIGTTLFDEMVADGRMPKARKAGARVIWDRVQLDMAFSDLPAQGENMLDKLLRGEKQRA